MFAMFQMERHFSAHIPANVFTVPFDAADSPVDTHPNRIEGYVAHIKHILETSDQFAIIMGATILGVSLLILVLLICCCVYTRYANLSLLFTIFSRVSGCLTQLRTFMAP